MTLSTFLSCLLLVFLTGVFASSEYHEQLVLQPLVPASLLASFNFRSNASLSSFDQQHFGHFPRSLGQIIQHASTKELHLRFSTGRWDAESWGTRPWDGTKEGGTGVEIWAWIEADTEHEAFTKWITLNNALSGLFCASMNFIDSTRTTRPVMTFEPTGNHNTTQSNLHLLHGTLPREVVCTENLTPFLKLLPCKGKAGIGSLFDGHKLFDATWQTMSIDVRPVCPRSRAECVMEMEQTVDMVVDVERSKRPRDDPIPRPLPKEELICDQSKEYPGGDACYPLDLSEGQQWSFISIFGRMMKAPCRIFSPGSTAGPSVLIKGHNDLEVWTTPGAIEAKHPSGFSRTITVPDQGEFELVVPKQDRNRSHPISIPPLFAERSITGHGQERGGVRALLRNPSPNSPVEFVYFEALPWFMKPYLHTLKVQINGKKVDSRDLIRDMYYRPGLDRSRGSQLELHMTVPAASTVTLTYDFEKAILRYTEYPPDANRGRDVAPAVIRIVSSRQDGVSQQSTYLRTTPLMLTLPTPDFSMPYNVIILTSTVIALAFGTIFNMLVRRFVGADEVVDEGLKGKIKQALQKLKSRLRRSDAEKKTQ